MMHGAHGMKPLPTCTPHCLQTMDRSRLVACSLPPPLDQTASHQPTTGNQHQDLSLTDPKESKQASISCRLLFSLLQRNTVPLVSPKRKPHHIPTAEWRHPYRLVI
uniref:Uncharacterized protein n=1 Tax=Arundo donax TaxID=35708 RepID=A0A0A8YT75_ARUDO